MYNKRQQINNSSNKSRRIASNTLTLFVRMFVIMLINLYAVRLILNALGAENYGTFNAVAGVVLSSSFLTTTLGIAIQRFYSYSIGKHDIVRLQKIFSASINIVSIISFGIILLFETIGLWFLNTHLSIPENRLEAANWIFQFALFSFILSLIQLPYTAAIFANEDIKVFAFISLAECLLRLFVAMLIGVFLMDGLVFYGLGLFIVACIVFILYSQIARYRYQECHYVLVRNRFIYKELASFSGWTMYGAMASVMTTQGNTVLLNIFFGTVTTASYAISLQVLNAFQALSNTIVLAFRPAMIKSYAEQNFFYLNNLFLAGSKCILYLLIGASLPLIMELRTIFSWWLNNVTEETILFARLILIYCVCLAMHSPITTIVQATGKIKNYSLWVETVMLMCLPVSWFLFKFGVPAWGALLSMIGLCIFAHIVRIICLYRLYAAFQFRNYLLSVLIPGLLIAFLGFSCLYIVHQTISHTVVRFLIVSCSSVIVTGSCVYLIGITQRERLLIHEFVKTVLKRLPTC